MKHVHSHNGKFTFQLTILGHPCRTSAHYDTQEDAALTCDLVKHYLRTEFKLDIVASLDGEQFSSLAYSRRGVNLSEGSSIFKAIPEDVREFIMRHREALYTHRDSQPAETLASKLRRSWNFNNQPEVRDYVNKLECAELDREAFAQIDSGSFFLRLKVVESSFQTALKSLKLAVKMHAGATDLALVARADKLAALVLHLELNLEYVKDLTANLRAEEFNVRSAVANLEASRPALV